MAEKLVTKRLKQGTTITWGWTPSRRRSSIAATALALSLLPATPAHAATPCADLVRYNIPRSAFGLPSGGARITTAVIHPATADLPETCRVNGEILPSTRGAPPIKFQINLPVEWNGKALQFGGGGFNGILVDGLRSMPGNDPISDRIPNPLIRGFATFGSDGGHQPQNMMDTSFGRNLEARENYTGAAVKRLRDAAVAIIQRHYGSRPRRTYYAGGSKGGHEGLVAAQRYGTDYDGVISYFPAKDSVGLILGWGAMMQAAYGPSGTPIPAKKQAYIRRKVIEACDGLDGLKDGVIANSAACAATITPASLTCLLGPPTESDCLTPAEAATLEVALRRTTYPFPLANGVTAIGPFPALSEAELDPVWLSRAGQGGTAYNLFISGIVRDFWTGDSNATYTGVDFAKLRETILAHSNASDATSTDLDKFAEHGGKLILVQGSADMLVPPSATTDYYLRVSARYGDRTRNFARYFVQPGYGHGTGPFRLAWDSLAALDTWVESGSFPDRPVAIDSSPGTLDRQMPLCEYPHFPRYQSGDSRKASSFACSSY